VDISESQLDEFGQIADTANNLYAAATLPGMSAEFHKEQLQNGMKEIARRIRGLYIEVAGDDPWVDQQELFE